MPGRPPIPQEIEVQAQAHARALRATGAPWSRIASELTARWRRKWSDRTIRRWCSETGEGGPADAVPLPPETTPPNAPGEMDRPRASIARPALAPEAEVILRRIQAETTVSLGDLLGEAIATIADLLDSEDERIRLASAALVLRYTTGLHGEARGDALAESARLIAEGEATMRGGGE